MIKFLEYCRVGKTHFQLEYCRVRKTNCQLGTLSGTPPWNTPMAIAPPRQAIGTTTPDSIPQIPRAPDLQARYSSGSLLPARHPSQDQQAPPFSPREISVPTISSDKSSNSGNPWTLGSFFFPVFSFSLVIWVISFPLRSQYLLS